MSETKKKGIRKSTAITLSIIFTLICLITIPFVCLLTSTFKVEDVAAKIIVIIIMSTLTILVIGVSLLFTILESLLVFAREIRAFKINDAENRSLFALIFSIVCFTLCVITLVTNIIIFLVAI